MLDDLDSYKRDFDGWLGRHGIKLLGRRTTGIVEGLLDLGALRDAIDDLITEARSDGRDEGWLDAMEVSIPL